MNKVIQTGRIGQNPEVYVFENGNKKVQFSIAVSERYKKKDATEYTEKVDWQNCVAFGHTAEFIERHVKKGDRVSLIGKLRQRSWDTETGKRYAHEIEVNEVEKWDWEKKSGDVVPNNQSPQQEPDDLPF